MHDQPSNVSIYFLVETRKIVSFCHLLKRVKISCTGSFKFIQNFKREKLNVANSSRKEVFIMMQQVNENLDSNQNSSEK